MQLGDEALLYCLRNNFGVQSFRPMQGGRKRRTSFANIAHRTKLSVYAVFTHVAYTKNTSARDLHVRFFALAAVRTYKTYASSLFCDEYKQRRRFDKSWKAETSFC